MPTNVMCFSACYLSAWVPSPKTIQNRVRPLDTQHYVYLLSCCRCRVAVIAVHHDGFFLMGNGVRESIYKIIIFMRVLPRNTHLLLMNDWKKTH